MAQLTTERMRKLLDELDEEEGRKGILDRLDAIERRLDEGRVTDTDREFLDELRRERAGGGDDHDEGDGERDAGEGSISGGEPSPRPKSTPKAGQGESGKRRTRPGRKSGAAYDWTVDEHGHVRESDVAVVYSGEDEPDEVDLPDDDQDDD